jgi:hypothetical protein
MAIMNIIRLGEKLIHQKINSDELINVLNFKQLEITFRIPSKSQYEHSFIALMMLTEKMYNLTPIFLLDRNTLSKKKSIKVGLILTIKDETINDFLEICCMHSIPKFYEYGISFGIKNKNNPFAYKLNRILSNTVFSFDKDINSFYNYLGEAEYEYDFLFSTYFKNILMNKLLITSNGVAFINLIDKTKITLINDMKEKIKLEELEELEELKKTNYEAYLDELKYSEEIQTNKEDFFDVSFFEETFNEELDNFFNEKFENLFNNKIEKDSIEKIKEVFYDNTLNKELDNKLDKVNKIDSIFMYTFNKKKIQILDGEYNEFINKNNNFLF